MTVCKILKTCSLSLLLLAVLVGTCLPACAKPADLTWKTPSKNASESMPCGGGDIGLNVWVEQGDILFYVSRSGAFDENNTLLKQGRFRVRLNPGLDLSSFRQVLHVEEGYLTVSDRSVTVRIWVDVFRPVIHVEMDGARKSTAQVWYESWRYEDRAISKAESFQTSYKFGVPPGTVTRRDQIVAASQSITFYHHNQDSTVFDATVAQQGLQPLKPHLWDPLGGLIFGGRMVAPSFRYQGTEEGVYDQTRYRAWRYATPIPSRRHSLLIALAEARHSVGEWQSELEQTIHSVRPKRDFEATTDWWRNWWNRSFIESDGESQPYTRNYTLFRYMMGCNAKGKWPTKFNGGLFCFDPSFVRPDFTFTPDYRRWGGGTHTAQNQRLLYWPMLKSGDYDALKPQLDFYLNILRTAEMKTRHYWGHGGANFTEQIENFGLPEHDEYGLRRPDGFDPGLEYNAWLEYTWDTVLEFCQIALESERYGGCDISAYIPWIKSSLDFFDEHYRYLARRLGRQQLDGNGKLVIYPGSGAETFKMAYNPSSTVAGLKVVSSSLIAYLQAHDADTTEINRYQAFLKSIPDIPLRTVAGHQVISPAVVWARVNNIEPTMLYPVFPWRLYGVGRDSLQTALDTWRYDPYVQKFNGYISWEQANIWAACLGLTDDAVKFCKLKMQDGPHRFPAFWGPGHDWTPDHNWGGSGMIGMQEMLMQEVGDRILLFPAWPKGWNVHFKLHASRQTTVEAELRNGKVTMLKVTPREREKDIEIR